MVKMSSSMEKIHSFFRSLQIKLKPFINENFLKITSKFKPNYNIPVIIEHTHTQNTVTYLDLS